VDYYCSRAHEMKRNFYGQSDKEEGFFPARPGATAAGCPALTPAQKQIVQALCDR
jgi:hypothetical protein